MDPVGNIGDGIKAIQRAGGCTPDFLESIKMTGPIVSVVIPAYNAMPYIMRCISSVAEQSIGQQALEVIVVDDGSTDGTAAELDRLSSVHHGLMQVIHQDNSGGPAAPRNTGLDLAQGRFVFFLDADDYLGTETLERMVAIAETNGTDIVLGKMVGVGGRTLPKTMFKRNQPKTDVFNSRVYWALNPLKLFRRDLLERHALRFPTGLPIGEDQQFVALAYLRASGISVIADYDCIHCTLREDGGNTTVLNRGSEPRLRFLPHMVDLLLEHVPPGPGRDHLAHRHLTVEVQEILRDHLVHESRETQQKMLRQLAEIIEPLWHDGMNDRLSAMARLRLHLVRHLMLDELLEVIAFEKRVNKTKMATPVVVEEGRALAHYPFLRDADRAIPNICYDVTAQLAVRHHVARAEINGTRLHVAGHAYIHRVETHDVTTELVLRERNTGVEYRLPVTHTETPGLGADEDAGRFRYEHAGFDAVIDIATAAHGDPIGDGLWDISLAIGAQGLSRVVRIGSKRTPGVSTKASTHVMEIEGACRAVTLYATKPHGNLTLDVGEQKHDVLPRLTVATARWTSDEPPKLEFNGRCTLTAYPDTALTVTLTDEEGNVATFAADRPSGGSDFAVLVPVSELAGGVWSAELRLGSWALPIPELAHSLTPTKWHRRGLPWYAKPVPGNDCALELEVARIDLVQAVIKRIKG